MGNASVDDVLESIDGWTVLDLNRLVKGLQDKYGISSVVAAPSMASAGGASAADGASCDASAERGDVPPVSISIDQTAETSNMQPAIRRRRWCLAFMGNSRSRVVQSAQTRGLHHAPSAWPRRSAVPPHVPPRRAAGSAARST